MKTVIVFVLGLILGAVGLLAVQIAGSSASAPPADRSAQNKGDIQLTLRSEYLTRLATDQVKTLGLPVTLQDVRVVPRSGNQLAMVGNVSAYGISVPATVTMQPSIVNGRLRVTVSRIDVQSLPIPADMSQQLESAINAELDKVQRGLPYRFVGLQVIDEGVVLDGVEAK